MLNLSHKNKSQNKWKISSLLVDETKISFF